MKMTDMRAKARAIFGPANPEPMPNQPNGAKALQERANARPIPTYKVGGSVKKPTPPQPTAAEREADRKRREEYAKMKVSKEQAAAITRGNRAADIEGGRYKHGGKVHTSSDTARKLATEMGGMKNGGKAKKDGLAVMIAIGSPMKGMKGMKKPVKKMAGGMASMIPAPDGPPAVAAPSGRTTPTNIDPYRLKTFPGGPGAAPSGKEAAMARMKAVAAERAKNAPMLKMMKRQEADIRKNLSNDFRTSRAPVPIAKGGVVKKAAGGAAKVRKGMMTPEGKITHAMNKMRGK
jgi:hypothetical protein